MDIETVKSRFPNIRSITLYIYKVDMCQHGKECTFKISSTNTVLQISCNLCAQEFGYTNPTYIHSNLCKDYNCICDLQSINVYKYLQSALGTLLPSDIIIHYLVPNYQNLYKCNVCNDKTNLHIKKCIHCSIRVCNECVYDYCDKCFEIVVCKNCIHYGNTYFSSLIHDMKCNTCFYKVCKACRNLFKKCGWCLEHMCTNIISHMCFHKYEIVNKREYYWLQSYTNIDKLYQNICDWYQQTNQIYEPYLLYEVIKMEALQGFLEQGGYILDIPKSMRYLVEPKT